MKPKKWKEHYIRSTKCTLKYATEKKLSQWHEFLSAYVCVVNRYIDIFWLQCPANKNKLVKPIVDLVPHEWMTYRARRCAARHALSMVQSTRERHKTAIEDAKELKKSCKTTPRKPKLRKLSACLSRECAVLEVRKNSKGFDVWLHIHSIGKGIQIDIPLKWHKHYLDLSLQGTRCTEFIITGETIQIPFKIKNVKKQAKTGCVGIDTNIRCLAAASTGELFGEDLIKYIERVKRCKHGSKGQARARRALRHYIDTVVKDVIDIEGLTTIIVENLKRITYETTNPKRRLGKNMRRTIGAWGVGYWFMRLEQACERNRVSFNRVPAYYTSTTCPCCKRCHKDNRNGAYFRCIYCGFADHADTVASKDVLYRFLDGKYGKGCTALPDRRKHPVLMLDGCSLVQVNEDIAALSMGSLFDVRK